MQVELPLEDLESELHRTWGRRLAGWWAQYNEEYVEGRLRLPSFRIGQSKTTLGYWDGMRREITLSAHHILRDDWTAVLETLRHEMAHQYVHEVLEVLDETSHGPAFRQACERLRCSSKAGEAHEDLKGKGPDKNLRVIQKLLSLAQSPNENEAQAAVQKARRLLIKYNIDIVELDREHQFTWRILGPVKARHTSAELWIGVILSQFFFVESLWCQSYDAATDRRGTALQIYGTPQNLEMASYVYAYLTDLLPVLWETYREDRGLRGNRERQRYFAGVLEGFHSKLSDQEAHIVQSEALAWKGDARLGEFFRYHNPQVITRSGGGVRRTETYDDGVADGRKVSIRKPMDASGTGVRGLLRRG